MQRNRKKNATKRIVKYEIQAKVRNQEPRNTYL
jgi:hypothetical protein